MVIYGYTIVQTTLFYWYNCGDRLLNKANSSSNELAK